MKKHSIVAILITCLALLLSIMQNRLLWGYWISQPSLVTTLDRSEDLLGLSLLQYKPKLVFLPKVEKKNTIEDAVNYYCQSKSSMCVGIKRLLFELDTHYDDLDTLPDVEKDIVKAAYSKMLESGWLPKVKNSEYKETGVPYYGLVIHFNSGNDEFILLAYHTHEISNDRFAYSEVLLSREGDDLLIQQQESYYYEISGLEGLEWPVLWPINLSVMAIMYVLLATHIRKRGKENGKMQETAL